MAATDWQGGAPSAQQSQLLIVSAMAIGAVAGYGVVHWYMQRQPDAGPPSPGFGLRSAPVSQSPWAWLSWLPSRRLSGAPLQVAAERLAVLARSAEAIDIATRVPLEKRTSLAGLDCRPSSDSDEPGPGRQRSLPQADDPFSEADLESLRICSGGGISSGEAGGSSDGQVYKALRGGEHPIAIREFRHQLSDQEREQLQRLVKQLCRCKDKHIVRLLGSAPAPGDAGGLLIASPLRARQRLSSALAGPHAEEFLWYRRRGSEVPGRRELGRGRDIMLSVARGLQWLHAQGILHQDLRPDNVLLGKGTEVRLADAGLARFMHLDYMAAESSVGPFTWTAPEVINGLPPTPASDIWSLGIVLYQLLTGLLPTEDRRRKTKVPEDCPQAIQDLLYQCLDRNPEARPTAAGVAALLSTPPELLPRALRQRPGYHPPSGAPVQVAGGKSTVWQYTQDWINAIYGSPEAAAAAGYVPSTVEDVLDAREWDQYKDMIDELRGLIKEPDARAPGSAPFKRILQLHTAISKVAKIKLACTAQLVRERRIGQMGSMDSLLELAPGAVPGAEAPTPQRKPKGAQPKAPGRPSGGVRSASADAAVPAGAPNGLPGADTMRALSGGGGSGVGGGGDDPGDGDADGIDPTVVPQAAALAAMRLTPDQTKLLLTERVTAREAHRQLALERQLLVRRLYDYATGASHDQAQALEASAAIRKNIMEEGRLLHSQHTWVITELLSPFQYAASEVAAFPTVVDPPILLRLVAAAAEDHSSDEGVHLWQPIIKEGSFSNLGWRLNEEAAQSP